MAKHKSKREIEELVATLRPQPDAPTVVRKLPQADPPSVVTPLAPQRYKIQFTVSREIHEKFRRAQALLRHAIPSGDAAEIFDRAVTLLVEKLEKRRFAETSRPRASTASEEQSRYIPAAVRRAVWSRDGGRCAFEAAAGRCSETAFLEFHHVDPYAVGGAATVENIELRCRAHNVYEARLYFGDSSARDGRARYSLSDRAVFAESALNAPPNQLLDDDSWRCHLRPTSHRS